MKQSTIDLIEGEQKYSQSRWPDRHHSAAEWLLILEHLVHEARVGWGTREGDESALDIIRKIAATSATCIDQHKTPPRQDQKVF